MAESTPELRIRGVIDLSGVRQELASLQGQAGAGVPVAGPAGTFAGEGGRTTAAGIAAPIPISSIATGVFQSPQPAPFGYTASPMQALASMPRMNLGGPLGPLVGPAPTPSSLQMYGPNPPPGFGSSGTPAESVGATVTEASGGGGGGFFSFGGGRGLGLGRAFGVYAGIRAIVHADQAGRESDRRALEADTVAQSLAARAAGIRAQTSGILGEVAGFFTGSDAVVEELEMQAGRERLGGRMAQAGNRLRGQQQIALAREQGGISGPLAEIHQQFEERRQALAGEAGEIQRLMPAGMQARSGEAELIRQRRGRLKQIDQERGQVDVEEQQAIIDAQRKRGEDLFNIASDEGLANRRAGGLRGRALGLARLQVSQEQEERSAYQQNDPERYAAIRSRNVADYAAASAEAGRDRQLEQFRLQADTQVMKLRTGGHTALAHLLAASAAGGLATANADPEDQAAAQANANAGFQGAVGDVVRQGAAGIAQWVRRRTAEGNAARRDVFHTAELQAQQGVAELQAAGKPIAATVFGILSETKLAIDNLKPDDKEYTKQRDALRGLGVARLRAYQNSLADAGQAVEVAPGTIAPGVGPGRYGQSGDGENIGKQIADAIKEAMGTGKDAPPAGNMFQQLLTEVQSLKSLILGG